MEGVLEGEDETTGSPVSASDPYREAQVNSQMRTTLCASAFKSSLMTPHPTFAYACIGHLIPVFMS